MTHAWGSTPHEWNALTAADLAARGSLKWSAAPVGGIAAWVAEMDFGTAPSVADAIAASVARHEWGYPPPTAETDAAEALVDWYGRRYGWRLDVADVHPMADVITGLRIAITEFGGAGPVVVPTPAYPPFLFVPAELGQSVVEVPMLADEHGDLALDLDTIEAELIAGAHLVVLANPGNPTGRVYRRDELTALAEVVAAHGARVFSDEIHAPLTLWGAQHVPYASVSAAAAATAITATSASKAFNLPGLKAAQLILTNDADRAVWDRIGFGVGHGASTPGLRANAAAYRDGEPWLAAVIGQLERNAVVFRDRLAATPDVRMLPLQGTYLSWVDLGPRAPEDPAPWLLATQRLVVNPGPAFGAVGARGIRVNLAMPEHLVAETADRLIAAMASLG